jgi:hypothetical protein
VAVDQHRRDRRESIRLGEVLTTFDRIHAKGDTPRSVFDEFQRLGRQVRARGD